MFVLYTEKDSIKMYSTEGFYSMDKQLSFQRVYKSKSNSFIELYLHLHEKKDSVRNNKIGVLLPS